MQVNSPPLQLLCLDAAGTVVGLHDPKMAQGQAKSRSGVYRLKDVTAGCGAVSYVSSFCRHVSAYVGPGMDDAAVKAAEKHCIDGSCIAWLG